MYRLLENNAKRELELTTGFRDLEDIRPARVLCPNPFSATATPKTQSFLSATAIIKTFDPLAATTLVKTQAAFNATSIVKTQDAFAATANYKTF